MELTNALTNAVGAEPPVNKSRPKNLEYRPEILGDILKKISKFREIFTSLLRVSRKKCPKPPDSRQNLQIPGRILYSPETTLDTPFFFRAVFHGFY